MLIFGENLRKYKNNRGKETVIWEVVDETK